MGLGPSQPPPHTSLRCGYSNSNNSRAGPEETHHPGLQGGRGGGGLLLPHSQSVRGLESSARRGHPQGQACRRKLSPAQGGPPCPGAPEMLRWVCPHRRACRPWTHVCIQAASRSLPPRVHHVGGADLHPARLLGRCTHRVWPDPRVCRDRCPLPQTVLPGTPPTQPSLSLGVSTLPPLFASARLSVCLSPSDCLSFPLLSQS